MNQTKLFAAAIAGGLLITACGSSSKQGATSSTTAQQVGATQTTSGGSTPSGQPIKIMLTGVIESSASSFPSVPIGGNGAAQAINASGGVNGHPIDLIVCDDHITAADGLACFRQAVSDHVVAVIGDPESFSSTDLPILTSAGIPLMSPVAISQDQITAADSYPESSGNPGEFYESGEVAVKEGGSKVAMVIPDFPNGPYLGHLVSDGVKLAGGTVVTSVKYTIGTPDMASTASQLLASKPDAIAGVTAAGDTEKLIAALRQAGYNGPFVTGLGDFTTTALKQIGSAANNTWAVAALANPFIDTTETSQFRKEVPNTTGWAEQGLAAWLAVHTVADALKGTTTYTAQSLVQALNSAASLPTYGVVQTVNFSGTGVNTDLPRVSDPGLRVYKWSNGQFTEPNPTWISLKAS